MIDFFLGLLLILLGALTAFIIGYVIVYIMECWNEV